MTNSALLHAKPLGAHSADTPPKARGRANFFPARISCNPLISLVSDERIQGNPSFSNSQEPWVSRPKGHVPRKSKRAFRPKETRARPDASRLRLEVWRSNALDRTCVALYAVSRSR